MLTDTNLISTDAIFVIIILIYALIGMAKGGIRSIGGLIAMAVSAAIAYFTAKPITIMLFDKFGIAEKITEYISSTISGIQLGTDTFNGGIDALAPFMSIGDLDFSAPANVLQQNLNSLMDNTVMQFGIIFVMIVLFATCTIIFGLVVNSFEAVFERLPFGTALNRVVL